MLPPAMRGEVMPPTPLPFLGSARVPRKCLAPLFSGLPVGPRPPLVSGMFSQGCWDSLQLHRVCAILFRNSGALRTGQEGFKAVQRSRGIATVRV